MSWLRHDDAAGAVETDIETKPPSVSQVPYGSNSLPQSYIWMRPCIEKLNPKNFDKSFELFPGPKRITH